MCVRNISRFSFIFYVHTICFNGNQLEDGNKTKTKTNKNIDVSYLLADIVSLPNRQQQKKKLQLQGLYMLDVFLSVCVHVSLSLWV